MTTKVKKSAYAALIAGAVSLNAAGEAYFWNVRDGGPIDTVESWQRSNPAYTSVPGLSDDVVLQYDQNAPVTSETDMSIAELHFWGGTIPLGLNGHALTANNDASRIVYGSRVHFTSGTINTSCNMWMGRFTANDGNNEFVVDGPDAAIVMQDGKSWIVGERCSGNALVITNGASCTGLVLMGYSDLDASNNVVRVVGNGSTFTVPSATTANDVLAIGMVGGHNLFEVCDGATFVNASAGSVVVGTQNAHNEDPGFGENVLRVRNATFSSAPWLYCGYTSSSNNVEFLDGAQGVLSVLIVGNGKATCTADAPETFGNGVLVSGANTLLTVNSGIVIGWRDSHSNRVEVTDGATLHNKDDIRIGRDDGNGNGNVLSVSGGATYIATRQWSVGRAATTCGNAIVVDGGTFTDNSPDEAHVGYSGGCDNFLKVCNGGWFVRTAAADVTVGNLSSASRNELVISHGGRAEIPNLTVGVSGTGNAVRVDDGELFCSGVLRVGSTTQGSLLDVRGSNSRIEVGPIVVNRTMASDKGGTEIRFTLSPEGLKRVPLCSTEYNFYAGTKIVVDATDEKIPSGRYVLAELNGEGSIDVSNVSFDILGEHVHLDTSNPKEIAVKVKRDGMLVIIR